MKLRQGYGGALAALGSVALGARTAFAQADAAADVNDTFGSIFNDVVTVFGGAGALIFVFALAGRLLLNVVGWLQMLYIIAFGAIIGAIGPILDQLGFENFV